MSYYDSDEDWNGSGCEPSDSDVYSDLRDGVQSFIDEQYAVWVKFRGLFKTTLHCSASSQYRVEASVIKSLIEDLCEKTGFDNPFLSKEVD